MTYIVSIRRKGKYSIDFKFDTQVANVDVDLLNPRRLYVNSKTDGYHWLQSWMAQEPGAVKILELDSEEEKIRVKQSLSAHGFNYIPEDKETCYLDTEKDVTRETVDRLARYLEPRFALRERFFPTD